VARGISVKFGLKTFHKLLKGRKILTFGCPTYDFTHKKYETPNQKNYKTCQIFWGFAQLSSAFDARLTIVQSYVRSSCFATNRL